MSTDRPQLRIVDTDTGEVLPGGCPDCALKDRDFELVQDQLTGTSRALASAKGETTRLKRELAEAMGVEPEAKQILEVLTYWRDRVKPRAKLVTGSERWLKVRARLREKDAVTKEPCYTPRHLRAAVEGALLSDFHAQNGYLDAVTIFRDSKTVDEHIGRAIRFKQVYHESALTLVAELSGESLRWLAERCSCGHPWIEHLRSGEAAQGGAQRCAYLDCECVMFDVHHAKVERFMREQTGGVDGVVVEGGGQDSG